MLQRIKGTRDILSPEVESWKALEDTARDVFRRFGFREIRPPLMEWTELFARSIGQATDIVEKEMYSFTDSDGSSISLRPEGTAGIVRAFIQNRLDSLPQPVRLFTIGPMFRHENPQMGRYRQFHQIDAEVFGSPGPEVDTEVIAMAHVFFTEIGLRDLNLLLNSLGCPECRPAFRDTLTRFLIENQDGLCDNCRRRTALNPMRVLDCKNSKCKDLLQNAPSTLDALCPECETHFTGVKKGLEAVGIPFEVNPRLVRGLDYYTRTAFEMTTAQLGAQDAVMGGGRYDGLAELLGGPPTPAIGFAVGLDRLRLVTGDFAPVGIPDLFIAPLGQEAVDRALVLGHRLREMGFSVEIHFDMRSLKSQMKRADRSGARHVLIVGDKELASGRGVLRNMETKKQDSIDLGRAPEELKPYLTKERTEL